MFKEKTSLTKRIKEAIRPTPLRNRITDALFRLKIQLRRLERTSYNMQQRDSAIYGKCVNAVQSKNKELSAIYANECAEIRKMAKVVLQSQLALEQVALRLETIQQFGDVAYVMKPVAAVVGLVKSQLSGILPEVSMELGNVNESLEGMVIEVGHASDSFTDLNTSSGEAQKILDEANVVAEQKMKERFPELPAITAPEART